MAKYLARDLLNGPTLISLTRIPLAIAFTQTLHSTRMALLVLAGAAFSDVLDGFIARRFNLITPMGAVVDGVTDKIFAATVLATLVLANRLQMVDVVLLGTRELIELPLVFWIATSPAARSWRTFDEQANVFGKAATTLQFATIVAILGRHELRTAGLVATAIAGFAAGVSYWRRALLALRRA